MQLISGPHLGLGFCRAEFGCHLGNWFKQMGLCNAFCSDLLESSRGAAPNSVGQTTSTKSTSRELKHTSLQNALRNPPGVLGGGIIYIYIYMYYIWVYSRTILHQQIPNWQPFFKQKTFCCRKWRTWISTTRRRPKRPNTPTSHFFCQN